MIKLWAFFKRDLLEAASYKFSFVSSFFGIFLSSTTFFFISKLIPGESHSALDQYGGNYFAFVIVGIAFSGILAVFQGELPGVIRQAQLNGTLEAILVSRTTLPVVLMGSSLYSFFFSVIQTLFYILLAVYVFGMKVVQIQWAGTLLTFFLTAVCFMSIGILSACFILVYKKGNPFSWIFGSISGLMGGVFFPIEVLPEWIRWVSYLIPLTYTLKGLRASLLTESGFSQILPHITALLIFSVILFPLSLVMFRAALKKAKKDGSLTHY